MYRISNKDAQPEMSAEERHLSLKEMFFPITREDVAKLSDDYKELEAYGVGIKYDDKKDIAVIFERYADKELPVAEPGTYEQAKSVMEIKLQSTVPTERAPVAP